jgi:hypothetical protein
MAMMMTVVVVFVSGGRMMAVVVAAPEASFGVLEELGLRGTQGRDTIRYRRRRGGEWPHHCCYGCVVLNRSEKKKL